MAIKHNICKCSWYIATELPAIFVVTTCNIVFKHPVALIYSFTRYTSVHNATHLLSSSPSHYIFRPYTAFIRCLFVKTVSLTSPITCECDVSYLKLEGGIMCEWKVNTYLAIHQLRNCYGNQIQRALTKRGSSIFKLNGCVWKVRVCLLKQILTTQLKKTWLTREWSDQTCRNLPWFFFFTARAHNKIHCQNFSC
jgi:hypothetical protein